jgi:hypothetical protein
VPKSKKFPPSVIDTWPEVFSEIDVDVVPIEYLHSINIKFKDGKIWEIDVKKSRQKPNVDIETALEELFEQYENAIDSIDFKLDTDKVKHDIKSRTAAFMKKRK